MTEILTKTIPYGPEHRRELEAFVGSEFDVATKQYGILSDLPKIATETLCGISYNCYGLPDNRILVCRTDRYGFHTQASLWPDYQSWKQWWYVDRRRGEIDPETGRPFPERS